MNELIKVVYDNDRPTVSGRELYEKLEIKTRYNDWFARMCEYGFSENEDYIAITQKRVTAQGNETTYLDHQLTIEMAKQICMIQRTETGKRYREYFLEIEKEWNTPEAVMARAVKMADRKIALLSGQLAEANKQIEEAKPKVLFADAVSTAKTSILIGELSKLMKQNGVNIGQNRLFDWMRENGYLIKAKNGSYNMPTQSAMERGLLEIKESTSVNPDGSVRVNKTPKVTGKGQVYFINLFLTERRKQNERPHDERT